MRIRYTNILVFLLLALVAGVPLSINARSNILDNHCGSEEAEQTLADIQAITDYEEFKEASFLALDKYRVKSDLHDYFYLVTPIVDKAKEFAEQDNYKERHTHLIENLPVHGSSSYNTLLLKSYKSKALASISNLEYSKLLYDDVLDKKNNQLPLIIKSSIEYVAVYTEFSLGNFEEAIVRSKQCIASSQKANLINNKIRAYDAMAWALISLERHSEAKNLLEKVVKIEDFENVDKELVGNLYLVLAEIQAQFGLFQSAFDKIKVAKGYLHSDNLGAGYKARLYETLASVYDLADDPQNAIKYLEKASENFYKFDEFHFYLGVEELISQQYAKHNKWEKAFYKLKKINTELDSVYYANLEKQSVDNALKLENQALKNQLQKAEVEKLYADEKVRSDRAQLLGMIGVSVCISTIIILVLFHSISNKRNNDSLNVEVLKQTKDLEQKSEELKKQTKILEESNQELERFAYIASHDMKVPLRNVTSFVNLTERKISDEGAEKVGEYLSIAKANGHQMHRLVSDVLEFSKVKNQSFDLTQEFSIADLIKSVFTKCLNESHSKLEPKLTVTGDVYVNLSQKLFEKVFEEIIQNALLYNESEQKIVQISIQSFGMDAVVSIKDNGVGIPKEYQSKIFEAFKRLHTCDEYLGTGVGLALAKKLLLLTKGTIEVKSIIGKGSIFELKFPIENFIDEEYFISETGELLTV